LQLSLGGSDGATELCGERSGAARGRYASAARAIQRQPRWRCLYNCFVFMLRPTFTCACVERAASCPGQRSDGCGPQSRLPECLSCSSRRGSACCDEHTILLQIAFATKGDAELGGCGGGTRSQAKRCGLQADSVWEWVLLASIQCHLLLQSALAAPGLIHAFQDGGGGNYGGGVKTAAHSTHTDQSRKAHQSTGEGFSVSRAPARRIWWCGSHTYVDSGAAEHENE